MKDGVDSIGPAAALLQHDELLERLKHLLADPDRLARLVKAMAVDGRYDDKLRALVPEHLVLDPPPDSIEDHAHNSD
jgi:hypothetical protein